MTVLFEDASEDHLRRVLAVIDDLSGASIETLLGGVPLTDNTVSLIEFEAEITRQMSLAIIGNQSGVSVGPSASE